MKKIKYSILLFILSLPIYVVRAEDIGIFNVTEKDCGIFDKANGNNSLGSYLGNIYKIFKYAALVILIGLSIYELIGAIASGKVEKVRKSATGILKRVILCMVLFFLPKLVDLILKLAGYPSCIIGSW